MKIKILSGYPTYNFKITKKDIILGIGFIFCCAAVGFMAYVINTSVNGGM